MTAGAVRMAPGTDVRVAAAAMAAAGCGLLVAIAGAAAGDLRFVALGGIAAAVGLVTLLAAGWIDGAIVVALAVPLPALLDADGLRVAAVAPVTAAVVFAWLLRRGIDGARIETGGLPRRTLAVLIGAFALATVTSPYPLVAARESLNFYALAALLVLATDAFARAPRAVAGTAALLATVGAATGVLAVLQTAGAIPGEFLLAGTGLRRAALGFGQPNGLGLFLAVVLPLAVHAASASRSTAGRALGACALAAVLAGLFATFSRGAWVAVLAGTAPLVFTGDRRSVLRIWLAAVAAAVMLDLASGGALRDRIAHTFSDWVVVQRLALMLAGVQMFLARPITGFGPGGFAEQLERFGAQLPGLWDFRPTPHNAYVQMAAETGVIGLAAFVLFLAVALLALIRSARRARRDRATSAEDRGLRRALVWSFATACAAGFFIWPLAHGPGQAVVLVAAMGFALDRGRSGPRIGAMGSARNATRG